MKRQFVGLAMAASLVAAVSAGLYVARSARYSQLVSALPTLEMERFSVSGRELVAKAVEDLKKEPRRADRWGELGYILAGNKDFDRAAPCFARAEELDSTDFRWPHMYAVSMIYHDRAGAIEALQRTLAIQPNVASTLAMLAEAYLEDGKEKEAGDLLRPLVTDRTDDPRLLLALARVEAGSGSLDRAISLAERAAQIDRRQRVIHQFLSHQYRRKGDAAKAGRAARLAELLPKTEGAAVWEDTVAVAALRFSRDFGTVAARAQAFVARSQPDEALRLIKECSPSDRREPALAVAFAMAKAHSGDFTGASKALDEASSPDDAPFDYARGVLALLEGKYAEAVERFNKTLAKLAGDPRALKFDDVHVYRGLCLQALGRGEESAVAFEEALKLNPGNLQAIVRLAEFYLKKNRRADAARILKDAALLEPTNADVKELQRRAE